MLTKILTVVIGMILTLMAFKMMSQRSQGQQVKVRNKKRGGNSQRHVDDLVEDPKTGIYHPHRDI